MPQEEEFNYSQISSDTWQGMVILHLGGKKTVKTTYTSKRIKRWLKLGKGVLVYDINNHPNFANVRQLTIAQLDYWNNKGIIKVNDKDIWGFAAKVIDRVRNTLIVFDDATPYFSGNLPKIFEDMMLQSRNHCNDYFINIHDFRSPGPAVFAFSDFIVLRDTYEDWDDLPSNVENPNF